MARIALVGPGALGGAVAAALFRSGKHSLVLCARRPLTELIVETPDETIAFRPEVWVDPSAAGPVDFVLVATKTYDSAGAGAWLERLASGGASVAVLQNGVEHRENFARWVPAERIVPVLAYCPAERAAGGRIRQRRKAELVVPDDVRGREFAALFVGTHVEISLKKDFITAAWEKLTVNSIGALNALLLAPAGIFNDPHVAAVAVEVLRESIAVGRAEGSALDEALVERTLKIYRGNPPDSVNSLHADRAAGRPMEIDARNGVIVRLGRKHGIATPLNAMLVDLLKAKI
jgi:2-dehydropantoate 2-reductase